jgi:hypothetical protein
LNCKFDKERDVFAAIKEDCTLKWNQSSVAVLKRMDYYMKAMKIADEALFNTDSLPVERHFRAPVAEPHYSFAYGNEHQINNGIKCPKSYQCSEIALWWTDLPALDSVESGNLSGQ